MKGVILLTIHARVNIAFIGSSIYLLVVILLVTLPVISRQIDLRSRLLIRQPEAAVTRDRVAIPLS